MHTTSQSRLLISGAYREDDTLAARLLGIIRRGAPFYLHVGGRRSNTGGFSAPRQEARLTKAQARNEALAAKVRPLAHLTALEIAQRLGVSRIAVYRTCHRFGITVRRGRSVWRDKEAA